MAEAVVHRDAVWVGHWLRTWEVSCMIRGREVLEQGGMGTYKLELGLERPHDQPYRRRRHELGPLLSVCRVGVDCKVGDPVDAC